MKGVSQGHSASVSASASVPISQLCISTPDAVVKSEVEHGRGNLKKKMLGPPVRRYIDGIVPHEAHHRLVQSKPRTPRRGGKDGSREEGDDYGIDETPEHLTRTVWLRLSLTGESLWCACHTNGAAAQTGHEAWRI